MSSGKIMIIPLAAGKVKKIYKISYFPKPYSHSRNKINVELDLSTYATNFELSKLSNIIVNDVIKKRMTNWLKS